MTDRADYEIVASMDDNDVIPSAGKAAPLLETRDVQKHFGLSHAMCGYVVTAPFETAEGEDLKEIQVFGGNEPSRLSGPFRKSRQLTESR